MTRALPLASLSLAAALALLPVSAAVAEEQKTPADTRLEAAAAVFEQKMEEFGARAERIQADPSLTETQKSLRVIALWSDYQPHVVDFTAEATRQAGQIAEAALAEIDVEAIVREAMAEVEPVVHGLTTNGAWAQIDPEQMVTYGLVAQYGFDLALDALEETALAAPLDSDGPVPCPA
ncbi:MULTISPECIES: hypothetical protein [unclassified Brevundimonas]|uniref:hypothetical protein n=1 Tax=unclassified Brevundimonas TaxID=2622653 RepID=UPI000E9A591A|nr:MULTISPECIES: hypothetical protein [unclassified Brevundimonas]HBY42525.1 hypothetical protein [Brevundimonas sp.]